MSLGWLLLLVGIAVLAYIGYRLFWRPEETAEEQPRFSPRVISEKTGYRRYDDVTPVRPTPPTPPSAPVYPVHVQAMPTHIVHEGRIYYPAPGGVGWTDSRGMSVADSLLLGTLSGLAAEMAFDSLARHHAPAQPDATSDPIYNGGYVPPPSYRDPDQDLSHSYVPDSTRSDPDQDLSPKMSYTERNPPRDDSDNDLSNVKDTPPDDNDLSLNTASSTPRDADLSGTGDKSDDDQDLTTTPASDPDQDQSGGGNDDRDNDETAADTGGGDNDLS
jgi:hypothetical protein